jgi:dienelactone hydrolase
LESAVSALRRRLVAIVATPAVLLPACAADGSADSNAVRSSVISHETTQDVRVFQPDAEGSWPVAIAYHGIDGSADQMAVIGERLAAAGTVVFAPSYRTDLTSEEGLVTAVRDGECGYRFARSVATDHDGDLEQPMTWIGWSLGALYAVEVGLREPLDPSGEGVPCFPEPPRPDVIVAVSGCYYESEGRPFDLLEPEAWANRDARIIVVAGEDDTNCPAAQSERLAAELRTRGHDVRYVLLEGADHFAPVFHRLEGGAMVPTPDAAAGDEVVRLVTGALADR